MPAISISGNTPNGETVVPETQVQVTAIVHGNMTSQVSVTATQNNCAGKRKGGPIQPLEKKFLKKQLLTLLASKLFLEELLLITPL